MTNSYYKPSGKFSGIFFLYYLLVLVIGVPLVSTIYVYLIYYVPFIYANLLITIGCGALLGFLVALAANFGKVRNPLLVLVTTFVAVCALLYVSWAVYIPVIFAGDILTFGERFIVAFELLLRPAEILAWALIINEVGVWTIGEGGEPIRGILLSLLWVVEFLLIAGLALATSWGQPRSPFSEEAGEWHVEKPEKIETDLPENFDSMRNQMENRNFTDFLELIKAGRTDELNFMSITVFSPAQEFSTEPHYLTLESKVVGKKDKVKATTLLTHLAIDTQNAREMIAAFEAQPTLEEPDDLDALEDEDAPDTAKDAPVEESKEDPDEDLALQDDLDDLEDEDEDDDDL